MLGPALDESAPVDCTVTWSFTDRQFTGPDNGSSIRVQQAAGFCRSESSESVPPGPGPVTSQKTQAVLEARKGHSGLPPVPALTTRAAVSFGGSWAPERGVRARWIQERFLPRPWFGHPRAALLPAPLPCGGRSEKECGKLRVSGKRQPWPGPGKGLCLCGSPSL